MTAPTTSPLAHLEDALIEALHGENLARDRANAAEPYVHAVYAEHEDRIHRLVDVIADGDERLASALFEALFDITHDGLPWMKKVIAELRAEG